MQTPIATASMWTLPQKILFRFAFCFILLWTLPFPLGFIPYFDKLESMVPWLVNAYNSFTGFIWNSWQQLSEFVAASILNYKEPLYTGPSGSGDRTTIFLMFFSMITIAAVATLIWSVLDRKRPNYNTFYYWTRVLLRYLLACVMLGYGFAKVFHLQMPFPFLSQLTMQFGDKSPMGLAWSFMGYSPAFSFFTGIGEVIGGLFLFWRRTTSLGALILLAVMGTVAMMNYTFDIPVKLHSSLYVVFALFLLIPDFKRLMNVLVWNTTAEPAHYPAIIHKPWMKKARLVIKYLFIIGVLISEIDSSVQAQKKYGDNRPKPPLYGIYNTEYYIRNNDTLPLLLHDTSLWKQIVIDFPNRAAMKLMNDTIRRHTFKVDTLKKTAVAYMGNDTLNKSQFNYSLEPPYLTLSGLHKGDSVLIRLKCYDQNNFLLVRQQFRWICELPLNR